MTHFHQCALDWVSDIRVHNYQPTAHGHVGRKGLFGCHVHRSKPGCQPAILPGGLGHFSLCWRGHSDRLNRGWRFVALEALRISRRCAPFTCFPLVIITVSRRWRWTNRVGVSRILQRGGEGESEKEGGRCEEYRGGGEEYSIGQPTTDWYERCSSGRGQSQQRTQEKDCISNPRRERGWHWGARLSG
jgi:hypothetical protein